VSRELTNSSLWRSLAGTEAKILIDLLALAPFKATSYNLYGVDIQLEKHELCFSCVKMAEKYKVTDHFLRRFFDKLAKHKILVKKKRKIDPSNSQTVCQTVSRTVSRTGSNSASPQFYTSITFCGWVFGKNSIERYRTQVNDQKIEPSVEPSVEPFVAHNKEVIKEEEKKEENINIKSACEKNFFSKQGGVKNWIPLERIKALDFPYADEIVDEWSQFCSKKRELVLEELTKYCDSQIRLQQTEMTLPIFDYRFRIVLKKAFNVKEYKTLEDTPFLRYLN
ncbi:MAG: hypothetical protein ACRCX5_06710, partial [Bacteroidales bacterium]